jgi:hypothetical protein
MPSDDIDAKLAAAQNPAFIPPAAVDLPPAPARAVTGPSAFAVPPPPARDADTALVEDGADVGEKLALDAPPPSPAYHITIFEAATRDISGAIEGIAGDLEHAAVQAWHEATRTLHRVLCSIGGLI